MRRLTPAQITLALLMLASFAPAEEFRLLNPTNRAYPDALVRLKAFAPSEPGTFIVTDANGEVPYQVEQVDGRRWIWICRDFAPGQARTFKISPGQSKPAQSRVSVNRVGPHYVLSNDRIALRVPAESGTDARGPVAGVRLGRDRWVGDSAWKAPRLSRFSASMVAEGPLFARVRLRYEFDVRAGLDHDVPAFSEIDVTVAAGRDHVEIAERHEMGREHYWELEMSRGWRPTEGRSVPFSGGAGSGSVASVPPPDRPLVPGTLPLCNPELFINLFPRWNQHYKDGWFFAAVDEQSAVSATVVRASRWIWPHDNSLRAIVRDSSDYAGLRCPTWHGRRMWWLRAGDVGTAGKGDINSVMQHAVEDLDKLNHEFVLEWPGKQGSFQGINPYNGGQVNPSSGPIRGDGRRSADNVGRPGDLSTLTKTQVRFHGDIYGSYWNYWSPENPNFFSDFMRIPIALATNLKDHPQFDRFRRMAIAKMREDLYHSVTLPGGAGQECPGYMFVGHWEWYARIAKEHFGTDDPIINERVAAAERFLRRISQPDGDIRRMLPMGDTHPGADGPKPVVIPPEELKTFAAEELPGFGVIFNHQPGTPKETYLAFKAGPNRGHYHGDQLAFHYCANARPAAVDHHCSYSPRAGQEHMHNRLAFFTDEEPCLNMDGYERLIAFKTSPQVDIAVGQVESNRLRRMTALPPEFWHQEWPLYPLPEPLVYRRTVVFLKNDAGATVVLRDQYRSPIPLRAAWCLHARDDQTVALSVQEPGHGGDTDGGTTFTDQAQDFSRLGAAPGWVLDLGAIRTGRGKAEPVAQRYTVRSAKGNRLFLDRPVPAAARQPYILFRPTFLQDGPTITFRNMSVYVAKPTPDKPRFFPWHHQNGAPESTQGVRLEVQGRDGEYITVLAPRQAPPIAAIPGGVKVGDVEVAFAGSIAQDPSIVYVNATRQGTTLQTLTGADINLDHSQGDVGLFVPDAGYPFGEIPGWLLRQRAKRPEWVP